MALNIGLKSEVKPDAHTRTKAIVEMPMALTAPETADAVDHVETVDHQEAIQAIETQQSAVLDDITKVQLPWRTVSSNLSIISGYDIHDKELSLTLYQNSIFSSQKTFYFGRDKDALEKAYNAVKQGMYYNEADRTVSRFSNRSKITKSS